MTTLSTRTEESIGRPARVSPEAPVGRSTPWWGMVLFICTEAATFAAFLASYFYLRFTGHGPWPPVGEKRPDLVVPGIGTGVLVLSCVTMAVAVRTIRNGRRAVTWLSLAVTFLAGAAFIVLQILDWYSEWPDSTISKDAYGSMLYTVTGLHTFHVLIGLVMALVLLVSVAMRRLGERRPEPVGIVALYWYFIAVLAVAVYLTVYISPYL